MNKTFFIGNLTKDPEYNVSQAGVAHCRMTVAVKRRTSDITDFFTVKAWRSLADNCYKYLSKGSRVAVFGELQNSSYETQSGEKRYVTDIVADEVQFLTGKSADKNVFQEKQEVLQENLPF